MDTDFENFYDIPDKIFRCVDDEYDTSKLPCQGEHRLLFSGIIIGPELLSEIKRKFIEFCEKEFIANEQRMIDDGDSTFMHFYSLDINAEIIGSFLLKLDYLKAQNPYYFKMI